jgi:hypothetical protein
MSVNKLSLLTLLALLVCTGAKVAPPARGGKKMIIHYNITFAPDLSNRVKPGLYPRPLNDVNVLDVLISDLYPAILKTGRFQDQKDKLQVDFINKGLINQFKVRTDLLQIDFGSFANQNARINYILDRKHPAKTFKKDSAQMVGEFTRINTLAGKHTYGADIWSYFNAGIDQNNALGAENPYTSEDDDQTYQDGYRNILILTTDGYIEAGIFNKGYDLSQSRIKNFRKAYEASGEKNLQAYFAKHKEFRIRPVQNPNLKNLEVLVMEMFDRSLSEAGTATVHPSDMEILSLFWTDWLKQSGVKRFSLQPCAASRSDAEKAILNFLGVRKLPGNA